MSKVVKIPSHMVPCFVCEVNGQKYFYPAGTEQEVPDAVASVIENFWSMVPVPAGKPYQVDEASIPESIARDEEVLEMIGGGGNAVQYVPQNLTPEQKEQARENIGAEAAKGEVSFVEEGTLISFNASGGESVTALTTLDVAGGQTVTLQHCGENLLDMSQALFTAGGNITYQDGWYVAQLTEPQSKQTVLDANMSKTNGCPVFTANTKYRIYIEISGESHYSGSDPTLSALLYTTNQIFNSIKGIYLNKSRLGKMFLAVVETMEDISSKAYSVLTRLSFPANTTGLIKFRIGIVKAEPTEATNNDPAYNPAPAGTVFPEYAGTTVRYTFPASAAVGDQYTWPRFTAYAGENNIGVGVGVVKVVVKGLDADDGGYGASTFDPTKYNIPILYLSGQTSQMSKENAVTLNYSYEGKGGTCTMKFQGSSSLAWPKKNFTIKFDTAFEAKEGWGTQNKYVLKANFIDFTHCRNVVSAKLWGQIVASRSPANATLAACPNYGAVDGFPVCMVLNDVFWGVYTFNIPKDGWMMNMGSGTQECILCADNHRDSALFKANATFDGDFDVEYITNENNTAWALTSLNNLINACIASNGSDLDTTIANMLDWESAIDYYILVALLRGDDMVGKNYLLSTYNGTKWFFTGYDMDTTYGLTYDGKKFVKASGGMNFEEAGEAHRVFELIRTYKKDALKARYQQLRNTVMSEDNVAYEFLTFAGMIPRPMMDEDNRLWTTIPNTNANTVQQILNWYRMRCAVIDAEIQAM